MPIKEWEVYDAYQGDPESTVKVKEWDAEDAAKAGAEKLDMRGDFCEERTVMVREVGKEKWEKFDTTAETDIVYSARESEEDDEPEDATENVATVSVCVCCEGSGLLCPAEYETEEGFGFFEGDGPGPDDCANCGGEKHEHTACPECQPATV